MISFLKFWLYATIIFLVLFSATMYIEHKIQDLPYDHKLKRWWRKNVIGEEQ